MAYKFMGNIVVQIGNFKKTQKIPLLSGERSGIEEVDVKAVRN